MPEQADLATFVGNTSLYKIVNQNSSRVFLQRNIHQVLDSHQQELDRGTTQSLPSDPNMLVAGQDGLGWDYPTMEMLEELTKGRKPVLKVTTKAIKALGQEVQQTPRPDPGANVEHDWLSNVSSIVRLPCRVDVRIWDFRLAMKDKIIVESQDAVLLIDPIAKGGLRCKLELHEPFHVEISRLFVVNEAGFMGSRRWKSTTLANYRMFIHVSCLDSDDAAEMLSLLEDKPVSSYSKLRARDMELRASWLNLPECPPPGKLLKLQRMIDKDVFNLNYGIELCMGWSRKDHSPLELYNRASRFGHLQLHLPTPSASDKLATAAKSCQITYIVRQGAHDHCLTADDFHCVFCSMRLPHSTFTRLHFHLLTSHAHFSFEVEDAAPSDDGKAHKLIWMERTDNHYERAGTSMTDERELLLVAPRRPFDLNAFLGGDNTWANPINIKQKEPLYGVTPMRASKPAALPPAPSLAARQKAPEVVKPIPAPKRKKFAVLNVKGVRFYRTTSKRELETGEMISESDDDIDESWLARSQRQEIGLVEKSKVKCEFLVAYNEHLDEEQIPAGKYMGACLVRFAKKHKKRLADNSWRTEFRKRLKHFHDYDIIGAAVLEQCLESPEPADLIATPESQQVQSIQVNGERPSTTHSSPASRKRASESARSRAAKRQKREGNRFGCGLRESDDEDGPPDGSERSSSFTGLRLGSLALRDAEGDVIMTSGMPTPRPPSRQSVSRDGSVGGESVGSRRTRYEFGRGFVSVEDTTPKPRPFTRFANGVTASNEKESPPMHTFKRPTAPVPPPRGPSFSTAQEAIGHLAGRAQLQKHPAELTNEAPTLRYDSTRENAVVTQATNVCLCGKQVKTMRECIACVSLACVRKDFHIKCVGLEKRISDWKCKDCLQQP